MEDGFIPIFGMMIPLVGIIGAYIMIVYLRRFENTEKLAMIEKGVSPEFFNIRKRRSTSGPLRASLLLIGIGLGFFLGYFLDMHYNMEEVGYFAMLFIFGGTGLGLAYIVEEKKLKEESKQV
jgi:F0F1-type ATP synthase assembly protein I